MAESSSDDAIVGLAGKATATRRVVTLLSSPNALAPFSSLATDFASFPPFLLA